MKSLSSEYPRIYQYGMKVVRSRHGTCFVRFRELGKVLKKHKIEKVFSRLFGIQTMLLDGPYASDVEAVLERIKSGKLTGTQLIYD